MAVWPSDGSNFCNEAAQRTYQGSSSFSRPLSLAHSSLKVVGVECRKWQTEKGIRIPPALESARSEGLSFNSLNGAPFSISRSNRWYVFAAGFPAMESLDASLRIDIRHTSHAVSIFSFATTLSVSLLCRPSPFARLSMLLCFFSRISLSSRLSNSAFCSRSMGGTKRLKGSLLFARSSRSPFCQFGIPFVGVVVVVVVQLILISFFLTRRC